MIIAQETTDWGSGSHINHIYFLDNSRSKMYAYIQGNTLESKIFKNPISISIKGRSFEILREINLNNLGVAVTGSKGDTYYVTDHDGEYKCTCTGYKYHGTCKHIEKVMNERTIG